MFILIRNLTDLFAIRGRDIPRVIESKITLEVELHFFYKYFNLGKLKDMNKINDAKIASLLKQWPTESGMRMLCILQLDTACIGNVADLQVWLLVNLQISKNWFLNVV